MAGHRQAEKDATELLDQSWDGALPVDPVRIAKDLGIEVLDVFLKKGSPDVSVGHVIVTLAGRGGHNPPSFSIAREINASGE